MKRFVGSNVVVTGAASGIGAACVRRLLDEGAHVVAVDVSQKGLDELIAELVDSKDIEPVVLDVSNHAVVERAFVELRRRHGALHGVINCAGITGIGSILDTTPEMHERIMSINLTGTINMCQAFARVVKDDTYPRAIVNVSSGAGVLGYPNRISYVASKFGVSGITKSMCPELGPLGIRVNAVAPGVTKTPLVNHLLSDAAAAERVKAAHPIGRAAEPEEIAAVIVFLLTSDASFMTGAVVSVDGGQTACL